MKTVLVEGLDADVGDCVMVSLIALNIRRIAVVRFHPSGLESSKVCVEGLLFASRYAACSHTRGVVGVSVVVIGSSVKPVLSAGLIVQIERRLEAVYSWSKVLVLWDYSQVTLGLSFEEALRVVHRTLSPVRTGRTDLQR